MKVLIIGGVMGNLLQKLAVAADGRYFTADEQRQIREYAESLPARLAAMHNLEQIEEAALRSAIEELQEHFPNFSRYHDQAWARHFRDLQLVVRAAAVAMVLDDPQEMDDQLLFWLRTMFAANNYTPAFVRESLVRLGVAVRNRLEADATHWVMPYLDRAVQVLSEFPEPATAAV
jgi:hypothetical protein